MEIKITEQTGEFMEPLYWMEDGDRYTLSGEWRKVKYTHVVEAQSVVLCWGKPVGLSNWYLLEYETGAVAVGPLSFKGKGYTLEDAIRALKQKIKLSGKFMPEVLRDYKSKLNIIEPCVIKLFTGV